MRIGLWTLGSPRTWPPSSRVTLVQRHRHAGAAGRCSLSIAPRRSARQGGASRLVLFPAYEEHALLFASRAESPASTPTGVASSVARSLQDTSVTAVRCGVLTMRWSEYILDSEYRITIMAIAYTNSRNCVMPSWFTMATPGGNTTQLEVVRALLAARSPGW